ncbi:alpha/beta hydrolase [Paralimibaculum aggregatum]|uniref:Alpha/beta hydrolase n=1 Tax=Paralimibaculum aggregatum TaxID=3036245 RepID=A0ABQ6LMB1_9RHOB|nr:alpha/beta fold hydrolase [Limibaculum sp. NKW23]GMG84345.1 alpha/beta hydrolase [Limibaculum sp. NKW23]
MATNGRRGAALIRWRLLGALAALLLAGCSAGGPMPPVAGVAEALPDPATLVPLAPETVRPAEARQPRAVVLAVHGFGDHGASTFGDTAADWAAAGILTYAPDRRGFGHSPSFGRWAGADRLVADLRAEIGILRARHPCLPLVVVGHSMGGGLALAAAPGAPIDGLVLAAPAIWGGDALNPLHRAAAWVAALLVPEQRFTGEGVVRIQPSDNIEMLRALARDPLHHGPPSARELLGLVRVTDRAAAAAGEVTAPALLLLGEKDEIVPERATARVFARLAGPRETIRYPEGWHMLFRDLQAARVRADVAAWVLARARPAACTALRVAKARPDTALP